MFPNESKMKNISRRNFLVNSSVVGTTALAAPMVVSASMFGAGAPSNQVNVGLIGCRNMGFYILERHLRIPGVKCLGLCDIDENILMEKAATVEKEFGHKPKVYRDFRKMLEDKDVDIIIVGTPDHWHCLQTVYACQAGKDVYVEKPMANSIEECNIMVRAANSYNRIVQVGQQQRSGKLWSSVINHVRSGKIGTLRKINIWGNYTYGIGGHVVPDSPAPPGVDYDMWLGPAPKRAFNESRYHRYWRFFWNYGGGVITDWGAHLIDMALWAKEITRAPETVHAFGKNLSLSNNAHEAFDTMSVIYPMDDCLITWDHTGGITNGPWDKNYGLAFVGDNGTLVVNRDGGAVIPEVDPETKSNKTEEFTFAPDPDNHSVHVKNFIDCVKSRDTPACPPETGQVVATFAHMANIAARTGEGKLIWDDRKSSFRNSPKANELITPVYRKPWELPKI